MFQTILNPDDVFRTDLCTDSAQDKKEMPQKFSTNPVDYISPDGFYL